MLEQIKLKEIVDKIAATVRPTKIILFGSYAAGNQKEDSDLDLLVVVDESQLPLHKRARVIRKNLWGMSQVAKDILVFTEKEIQEWKDVPNSFIADIMKTGRILYEN